MSSHCNCFKAERKTTRLEAQDREWFKLWFRRPICKVPYILGVGRNEDKKHINEFKIAGQPIPKMRLTTKKMKTTTDPKQS